LEHGNTNHTQGNEQDMTRKRNEGGRYSAKDQTDWYKAIEAEHIQRIEQEWQLKQAIEEYYEESDGDLVPWDRAA
jgi:IS30 family transposase